MLRNYFLLNLLLALIIAALGLELHNVLTHPLQMPSEAAAEDARKKAPAFTHGEKPIDEGIFDAISRLDLFRPSRSASLADDKKAELPPLKPPPKLFGTVIFNENKTAILQDSETKTSKVYRINEFISGYKVIDILEDRVVLLANEEKVEVKLREDKGIAAPARTAARPSPLPSTQVQNGSTTPQRRSRPVPPRRRASVPPQQDNTNVPVPEAPQAPEVPQPTEVENDAASEAEPLQ